MERSLFEDSVVIIMKVLPRKQCVIYGPSTNVIINTISDINDNNNKRFFILCIRNLQLVILAEGILMYMYVRRDIKTL